MSEITAIMIDAREPKWVKSLRFGEIPTMVTMLESGDIQAVTSDGFTLVIERKTMDDFLNTLREERLFPQVAKMLEVSRWSYLIITGIFQCNHDGKVITDRGVTGWNFAAVMGTILSIQEMGVFVIFANGDADYENTIIRLGKRSREPVMTIAPARTPNTLGPKATVLLSLPGIGIDRMQDILDWAGNNLGHALMGLTDMTIDAPVGLSVRRRIRDLFSLRDGETLMITPAPEAMPIAADLSKLEVKS